jgi:hypothetical protein
VGTVRVRRTGEGLRGKREEKRSTMIYIEGRRRGESEGEGGCRVAWPWRIKQKGGRADAVFDEKGFEGWAWVGERPGEGTGDVDAREKGPGGSGGGMSCGQADDG